MTLCTTTTELTKELREQCRTFFRLSLNKRTDKKFILLYKTLFHSVDIVTIDSKGVNNVTIFDKELFLNPSSVFIYFVRNNISVFTTISFVESHPFFSNSFHTIYSNEMCVYGTIWNNQCNIEHNSCLTFIMDIPANAFFIDCWFPSISCSLYDLIACVCQSKDGFHNYACIVCKYVQK